MLTRVQYAGGVEVNGVAEPNGMNQLTWSLERKMGPDMSVLVFGVGNE
jgi:hypothetical protein